MVAALVTGLGAAMPLVMAAALGFVAAIPLSWIVAKRLNMLRGGG